MNRTVKLIICTERVDFESMVAMALEKKGVVTKTAKWTEQWLDESKSFDFGADSPLHLVVVLIQHPDNLFSLKLADAIKFYNPSWVGMIGLCSGKILGTTFFGFSATKADGGDVLSSRDVQTTLSKSGSIPLLQYFTPKTDGYIQFPPCLFISGAINKLPKSGVNPQCVLSARYAISKVCEDPEFKMIEAAFFSYEGIREDCESELKRRAPDMFHNSYNSTNTPVALDRYSYDFFEVVEYLKCNSIPVIKCVSHVGGEGFLENKLNTKEFKSCFNQKLTHESQHLYKTLASKKAARCMMEFLLKMQM